MLTYIESKDGAPEVDAVNLFVPLSRSAPRPKEKTPTPGLILESRGLLTSDVRLLVRPLAFECVTRLIPKPRRSYSGRAPRRGVVRSRGVDWVLDTEDECGSINACSDSPIVCNSPR